MTDNPVLAAIARLQVVLERGETPSVEIDTDTLEPMDEDDMAALIYFMTEDD